MTDLSRTRKRAWQVVHAIENGSTRLPLSWAPLSAAPALACHLTSLFYRIVYFGRNTSGKSYFPSADLRVVIKTILFDGLSGSGATTQISL